jgi:pectinesterase
MKIANLLPLAFGTQFLVEATAISQNLVKRTARTSPPAGCLTVRHSGTLSGEYATVGAAVTALGSSTASACIFIYSGTWDEGQISIKYSGNLTLYGYTSEWVFEMISTTVADSVASYGYQKDNTVTLTRNINSSAAGSLDASSVLNVVSANFKAYNINFSNTYGVGAQAVAVTANGNQQGFYACGFYGYQDTLVLFPRSGNHDLKYTR